ncbi:hypothetical protein Cni_G25297 [Canna indica]|uniref:PGR5-like protein 1A, chloroplastic n=1 Tax=Canna indica TaxID=4628 RepID=A0AAQ3KXL4_9LILI|nr:hypothetical protein Cni_G25297 [Canna indica]
MPPSPSFSAAAAPAFHVLRARPFSPRDRFQLPARGWRLFAQAQALTAEGPSCLYVGPIETASKEMLEALYQQARDSYYNGNPLIVDDMFDKIELKLRLYGSKSVVKYPRCSLKRQSTYADAEEDPSQGFALASIWLLFLAFGSSAILVPAIYVTSLAFADSINSIYYLYSERPAFGSLTTANKTLTLGLGYLVGYPLAYASIQALQGLWRNELVAMKGSCPNCGEEVFTFVRAENSTGRPHRADCHVCDCALEFQTKVEQSFSRPGRRWVYGRVYLVQ